MSTTDEIMNLADMYADKFHPLDIREARAALLKAVESIADDAARYAWLRSKDSDSQVFMPGCALTFGNDHYEQYLDAAIDAAMQKETP